MGKIELKNLSKRFGEVTAIEGVNLGIEDSEIVSFLGPSGCGKTTTLRLIAGLEDPTEGQIYIDGDLASDPNHVKPPERRNLGMVFQNYAVWPHMTVFENVAYPLRLRHKSKEEIKDKVSNTLSLVGMGGMSQRYPEQLSGGQQQRVALARALVMEPTAMLLDEPLSNLDAKLRERMRFEIMELHKQLELTIVYVTHDQSEAMVLSDRIVLMQNQRVAQVGTAESIYREPINKFVADFVGVANFIECKLVEKEGRHGVVSIEVGDTDLKLSCIVPKQEKAKVGNRGSFFVRPEDINLQKPERTELAGRVRLRTFLGDSIDYRVEVGSSEWRVKANPDVKYEEGVNVGMKINRGVFISD